MLTNSNSPLSETAELFGPNAFTCGRGSLSLTGKEVADALGIHRPGKPSKDWATYGIAPAKFALKDLPDAVRDFHFPVMVYSTRPSRDELLYLLTGIERR